MKKVNVKRILFLSSLSLALAFPSFAQTPQVSTEPHSGAVVAVHPHAKTDSYFTAGEDGFITKWSADDIGEHFQITDLRITAVSASPASQDVAVAATDGGSIHKVEVMDWKTSSRKYTKQFKEPVVSVTFSPKGKFLFITTAEVQGNYILNAADGKLVKKIDQISTRIGFVYVADSEKSAIFYCPSAGQLIYYNLAKMQILQTLSTEKNLTQVRSFGVGEKSKGRFLAGVKQDKVYIVDAMSGRVFYDSAVKNPLIVDSADKSALYFTSSDASVVLSKVLEKDLLEKAEDSTKLVNPSTVARFPEVPAKKLCSVSLKNELSMMFGLTDGNVYEAKKSETGYAVSQITRQMYQKILDVQSFDGKFYILTSSGVYRTSYESGGQKDIKLVGKNAGQTDMLILDANTVILWSKKAKTSFQKLSLSEGGANSPVSLMTPAVAVVNAHIFDRNIVYTLSNSKVERYNIDTGKKLQLYTGNAVQDAMMLSSNTVYVAKASSSSTDSPIVSKSLSSGETAALKVDGYVAYAIAGDFNEDKNVYGITMKDVAGSTTTQVFRYFPSQRKSKMILKYNQEDQEAFVKIEGKVLYTNLGKHQVYAYDLETGRVKMYRRTSALPVKIASTEDRIAFLNGDGGIAWYNPLSQSPIAQWYLSLDGSWIEF
ncbi:MAG: hypothetical protein II563_00765 [Treponema sp.]|nr:hypothetical protein [Treponema sp.]